MAENMILCSFLGICSCYDCKKRTIPGWLLYTGILLGLIYAAMLLIWGQYSWSAILTGVLPGTFMLLLCHITEGKLGSADGMMVIPIGLMHQWQRCTAEVIGACLLTFFLAAVLIISRKGNRNTQIPFAPFLCTAVVLVWIIELCAGIGVDN